MKLKLTLMVVAVLAMSMALGYEGYTQPKIQGTPGSGLLYREGRVALYQNPNAFSGSGVYQARTTKTGPAYNPFPMPNTAASGRKRGYSSYIFLDNQLASQLYSHPELLQPRYNTNNQRYLGAYPYTYGFYGPASQRDKRVPLLDVSQGEADAYRNQMGYLTRTSRYQRQY